MRKLFLAFAALFLFEAVKAQFTENFADGDFTANPAWGGSTSDYIVNASFQLQSNNTTANAAFYLSTASTLATTAQWDFDATLAFNTSSANYVDVFLIASAADVTANTTNGYFVRMGGTDDEISLFRKDGATAIKIIDGVNGTLNTSNNTLNIRVSRDASNQWSLNRDITGTGTNFFNEGLVTDITYAASSFFGIYIKQSTASFFQKHFFDNIIVQTYVPDTNPPVIVSATATSQSTVDILFNEPVDLATSETASNYVVNNSIGMPLTAVRDVANASLVHLNFAVNFPSNQNHTVTINAVTDLAGNSITNGTSVFSYFIPSPYSVVIDELMADPTPLVQLPDAEWLELKNTTAFDINLQNWRVGKPTGISGPMPNYIIKADSFVVVCTGSAVAALAAFGPVISVTSFPSLNNTGDNLYLVSPQGYTIHSVNYTDGWYQNALKKDGGWSLEMIDTHNPCSGMSNWIASNDANGGTPGKKNSTDAINSDITNPKLLRAYAADSVHVTLVFNEPVDSISASLASQYSISDGIGNPILATALAPVFDRVTLTLLNPLLRNKIYTVTVTAVTDCSGNTIGSPNTARVGLYESTDSFDVVVNEILFNPLSGGNDYAEFYNRSNKILNLKNAYIANLNTAGQISSIKQFSAEDYLFFPGDFIVVTESAALVMRDYVAQNPIAFLEVSTMPSFNDDAGNVILLNEQGKIIDQLNYLDDWHFALISNEDGVALERIDYNAATQNQQNWHSAASSINYGTPTYKNSQYKADAAVQGEITVTPEIISPDNDGIDDFAIINYSFSEPGYVANISIFDANGRPVRYLQRNALNGLKGYYRWDGLGEKQQKLASGIYIIYTEVFNLQGKSRKFKNVIVVARRK